ncbi:hypothetical protein CL176_02450 [Suicoccus acidiformans]|uniref:PTS EIIA type-2 domain-containing protein n=1 Tax=Suicoccus acidiformans TaxID=2036206 RepID=A0A347WIS0_9LACT|nr:PTS sugar transporter subunit IIA [Suicoccus acidiformans]AXY24977.1 hypothetical protein CL176_02450 [Suicoccus acidiformans]
MALLDEKFIFIDLQVDNQDKLFEVLGAPLISESLVDEDYILALKEREKKFPTGLPLPIGVAIPHTEGSYVKKDKLVVATLKNSIIFNEMGGDKDDFVDVSLVIMLVIGDGAGHLDMLTKIISLVQDENVVKNIIDMTSETEIVRVFNEYLNL